MHIEYPSAFVRSSLENMTEDSIRNVSFEGDVDLMGYFLAYGIPESGFAYSNDGGFVISFNSGDGKRISLVAYNLTADACSEYDAYSGKWKSVKPLRFGIFEFFKMKDDGNAEQCYSFISEDSLEASDKASERLKILLKTKR